MTLLEISCTPERTAGPQRFTQLATISLLPPDPLPRATTPRCSQPAVASAVQTPGSQENPPLRTPFAGSLLLPSQVPQLPQAAEHTTKSLRIIFLRPNKYHQHTIQGQRPSKRPAGGDACGLVRRYEQPGRSSRRPCSALSAVPKMAEAEEKKSKVRGADRRIAKARVLCAHTHVHVRAFG